MGRKRKLIIDGKKQCAFCLLWLPLNNFGNKYKRQNGRNYCRKCGKERYPRKNYQRKKKIRIGIPSICEICGNEALGRYMSKDHDHITGQIRGWICTHCNSMLGFARDNIITLSEGIEYLKRYKKALIMYPSKE